MDAKIQLAVGLLDLATRYGPSMIEAVKGALQADMTDEENRETLRRWQDNEERAKRNAGLV